MNLWRKYDAEIFLLSRIWLNLQYIEYPNSCYSKPRHVSCLLYENSNFFYTSRISRLCVVWCGLDFETLFEIFNWIGKCAGYLPCLHLDILLCRDSSLSNRPFQTEDDLHSTTATTHFFFWDPLWWYTYSKLTKTALKIWSVAPAAVGIFRIIS